MKMKNLRNGGWTRVILLSVLLSIWVCDVKGCEESCRFSYDQSFKEYRQRCDQTTNGNVIVTDRAHFDGTSFLSLPMFQQNPLRPSFSIAFLFKYTGYMMPQDVAILSNGCENTEPTLELSLSHRRGQYASTTLRLRMTNDDRDMNISVTNSNVDIFREILVQIAQNESYIEVQVDGQPRKAFAKDVNDYIIQNDCPLQIGSGKGLKNFVGEFDEFIYFPCVNPGFFNLATLY